MRTCGRAIMHMWPSLVIAPQGRACSCERSTTMSSRRADVRVSHTFIASSRHATHGVHTCVLVWHATLGDTRCITGEQTGVLFAIACARLWLRVVFPRGQVGPRKLVHWCSKAASVLRPETGLVSWSRIWTKFSAYCIFTYTPHLGPVSDLRTWSVF